MKMFLMYLLVFVLIVTGGIIIYNKCISEKIVTIEPTCINKSTANLQSLYKRYGWEIGTELTWWEQYYDEKQLVKAAKQYDFPLVGIDFSTKTCIVSYGRKIVDIRYKNNTDNMYKNYIATITFEENYNGNVVYIYSIDKITFALSSLADSYVYKMVNGERVLWGQKDDINTPIFIPESERGK